MHSPVLQRLSRLERIEEVRKSKASIYKLGEEIRPPQAGVKYERNKCHFPFDHPSLSEIKLVSDILSLRNIETA